MLARAITLTFLAWSLGGCQPLPESGPPSLAGLDATTSDDSPGGGSDRAILGGAGSSGPRPGDPYSVIALPDTQFYAATYPEIFKAQTSWIAATQQSKNIAFVVHEGDLVDSDSDAQWTVASDSLQLLDGVVPYLVSMGNHDYGVGGDGWTLSRSTMIDAYFPVSRFAGASWFRGTFDAAHIENNYALFNVPGGCGRWLVVSLEFGPRDAVLAWADQIVKQYPDTPAMVVTHAYLYEDSTRYDHLGRPDQRWNPHSYPIATDPGSVNDGEEIWQKLLLGNSNIRFVLCGHVLGTGTGRLTTVRPDGTVVHQILANYQMDALGGGGYLRVMQFDPAARAVHVRTYSPYLGASKTDAANDFVLGY